MGFPVIRIEQIMKFNFDGIFELSVEQGGNDNKLILKDKSVPLDELELQFRFYGQHQDELDNLNFKGFSDLEQLPTINEMFNYRDKRAAQSNAEFENNCDTVIFGNIDKSYIEADNFENKNFPFENLFYIFDGFTHHI